MNALGIIFSNIHNETIDELTRKRTTASIPFGAKYRLIDFVLSNFISANITTVGVLAKKNYHSLMDHIGNGRYWDLDRKNGGLILFPPYSSYHGDFLYENRLESLKSIEGYLNKRQEEYVVLTDCDSVNNVDYEELITNHIKNQADITLVYKKFDSVPSDLVTHTSIVLDENHRVKEGQINSLISSKSNVCVNIWVISRKLLLSFLSESYGSGNNSFTRDVVLKNIKSLKVYGFEYTGLYLHLTTLESYFMGSMNLLKPDYQKELFDNEKRLLLTKVRDSAPTRYEVGAKVSDSLLADGCIIEGTVINSVLFRGVHVKKGAIVKNCVLMQDTIVGNDSSIDHVITDKNVVITDNQSLKGCDKIPFYIVKNQVI